MLITLEQQSRPRVMWLVRWFVAAAGRLLAVTSFQSGEAQVPFRPQLLDPL
jgi:hypothetical protein